MLVWAGCQIGRRAGGMLGGLPERIRLEVSLAAIP